MSSSVWMRKETVDNFYFCEFNFVAAGKGLADSDNKSYVHSGQPVLLISCGKIISLLASLNVHLKPFRHF